MRTTLNRKAPWVGLGKDITGSMNLSEALANADLNFNVVHKDICIAGESNIIAGYQMNVREDNGKNLGIVGSKYSIVQNRDAFNFLDEMVDNGMQFDMGGVTKDNKKVWIMGRMPDVEVLDDAVTPYVYFGNTFDGSGSVNVALVMLRQICSNGMCLIARDAKRSWSIRHSGEINHKLDNAISTMKLANDYIGKFEENANKLAELSVPTVSGFLDYVFPMPIEGATDRQVRNVESQREQFLQIYNHTEDIAKFRMTAYGIYLATTDFVSHASALRETATFAENRFMNLVKGAEIELRAQSYFNTIR